MRSLCVAVQRRPQSARALFLCFLTVLITVAMVIPEAEAARRKKRWVKAYNPPYASIVYDVNSGRVLQETNSNALRHPASVTKVMTLYMLFEQLERGRFKLDSELPVSAHASRQAPSKLGLKPGETISVEDAIKALVTKSANDIAVVVAEAVGGSEERFAELMTAKARSIGMSRSVFRNASGLPNPEQVTTARDLVTLGRAIQDRFPRYYPYFGTRVFEFNGWAMRNHNRLLGRVEGVDGIKTGYTRASGFNLLTSAKTEGRHLITVVLGGRSGRARDAQVAALVESHMPRAVAGRRAAPRTIDVAALDEDEEEKPAARSVVAARPAPAPQQLAALEPPRAVNLPAPPSRPRPAVIAETGDRQTAETGLSRTRQLALSASGSTGVVSAATTPMALVSTTPRSPALRWVPGAPAAEPAARSDYAQRQESREPRPVPPANVRYTNALNGTPTAAEPEQPLPVAAPAPQKIEQRLVTTPPATPRVAEAPVVRPAAVAAKPEAPAAKAEPVAVRPAIPAAVAAPPARTAAALPAAARSGWVIQLAAADSEGKARSILDGAREKAGRLLAGAEPFTEPVAKGSATLFRARFAGFDADEAQNACKALKRNGFNCFAQKI